MQRRKGVAEVGGRAAGRSSSQKTCEVERARRGRSVLQRRTRRPRWKARRRRNTRGAAVSARSADVEDRATEMPERIARLMLKSVDRACRRLASARAGNAACAKNTRKLGRVKDRASFPGVRWKHYFGEVQSARPTQKARTPV